MNSRIIVVAGLLFAAAPAVGFGQQADVVVAPIVVTGEVTRLEPGRIIVLKSDGGEVTYTLAPDVALPAEVQLGRRVSVHTERGADGTTRVTRVVTTSVTPQGQVQRTTEETRVGSTGVVRQKTTTVTGEVVSVVPGKSIVIRRGEGGEQTLALRENVQLPSTEIQVGQRVTLHTEAGIDGSTAVSRIVTTSITPQGQAKRTVEETRTNPSGETTKTTTVTVQGKVHAYLPGKSLTVLKADGTPATIAITEGAQLPVDLAVGKVVTIRSVPGGVQTVVIHKD